MSETTAVVNAHVSPVVWVDLGPNSAPQNQSPEQLVSLQANFRVAFYLAFPQQSEGK